MMCVKLINMNDGFLKTFFNLGVHFIITVMEEMCASLNQNSSFIYSSMNEAIESRLRVQSTFKQQSH